MPAAEADAPKPEDAAPEGASLEPRPLASGTPLPLGEMPIDLARPLSLPLGQGEGKGAMRRGGASAAAARLLSGPRACLFAAPYQP